MVKQKAYSFNDLSQIVQVGGWVGLYGPRWGAWVLGARWGGLFWGRGLGL